METPRDDRLAAELRELRPTPRPEFAAELDQRAAAGFPRRSRWPRLSFSFPARRLLIPAGGLAVIAIAVTSAVVGMNESGHEAPQTLTQKADSPRKPATRLEDSASEAAPPNSTVLPSSAPTAGSSAGIERFSEKATPQIRHRAVERSAQLVLGAAPADIADDSSQVLEAVHAHDGIVMRSSTREGEPGVAGARFELLIPSAKLSDALAALSAIDEVRSRHEATDDITAPTVAASELLQDSKARIDSLLAQLEGAEAESEREAVEAELAGERRHRARLRAQLQQLERRADYSRVLVRIETGAGEESSGGGAWGVGDALDDAGKILAVAVAVTVVALAILGPIALIALLAWLTHRAWVRRERRRVLS
ncbi:MAG TPA: DUF4349 domain-containing protein [Solirubrobacterales bacterium]|nr:DUF4349 domain-containing protein [Solirubrobacterales bacterium]